MLISLGLQCRSSLHLQTCMKPQKLCSHSLLFLHGRSQENTNADEQEKADFGLKHNLALMQSIPLRRLRLMQLMKRIKGTGTEKHPDVSLPPPACVTSDQTKLLSGTDTVPGFHNNTAKS